jgi:acetyl esterase/lipase
LREVPATAMDLRLKLMQFARADAVEDAMAVSSRVSRQATSLGIDATRLVVGGDSAGATLGAVVCPNALRSGGPAILLQYLICPVPDFDEPSPSRRAGWCSTRSANKSGSPSKIDSNFNQFKPVH